MKFSQHTIRFLEEVEDGITEISFPLVMASAAGWFVGRVCWDEEIEMVVLYDRLTEYDTEKGAIASWEYIKQWEYDWAEEADEEA